ncbi:MAG: J domain-containing protein [Sphingomicrobium sp.]
MGADQSAYAALGLEPGADAAAIERAYKSLIKEHHPDRSGGDSARAAEINRAYRELRAATRMKDDLSLHPRFKPSSSEWSQTLWAIALLAVLGIAAVALSFLSPAGVSGLAGGKAPPGAALAERVDIMDHELSLAAIDAAVLEAARLSRTKDEMALASASRFCHRELRQSPSIQRFDRCAAFDNAVIRLQDLDPLRDKGPFSQIAVTGRLWSSAAGLSGDYMATDSRLQRIRLRVELLLTPAES